MPDSSRLRPLPTACGASVRIALFSPYCTASPVMFQYEFAIANASSCRPSPPTFNRPTMLIANVMGRNSLRLPRAVGTAIWKISTSCFHAVSEAPLSLREDEQHSAGRGCGGICTSKPSRSCSSRRSSSRGRRTTGFCLCCRGRSLCSAVQVISAASQSRPYLRHVSSPWAACRATMITQWSLPPRTRLVQFSGLRGHQKEPRRREVLSSQESWQDFFPAIPQGYGSLRGPPYGAGG